MCKISANCLLKFIQVVVVVVVVVWVAIFPCLKDQTFLLISFLIKFQLCLVDTLKITILWG